MKYRSKSVIKEAIQWTGSNTEEVKGFCPGIHPYVNDVSHMMIHTLEGVMVVSIGDYVIKGLHGEFYACKPDIFEKSYEKVEE